jgi:hypothetical protein
MVGSRRAPAMRVVGALAVAGLLVGQFGCYQYVPMASGAAPLPGQMIVFDINDTGRVALGGSIGPEISQIEGRVVRDEPAQYELSVNAVRLLRGGEQIWKGERIQLQKNHISRVSEKQLSKGRTVVASAGAVAIVAVFVGKKLIGSLTGEEGKPPGDSSATLRRPVRP